jgi:hypothetical protein
VCAHVPVRSGGCGGGRRWWHRDPPLTDEELDVVTAGFMRIRDQEPLDDVADWANAVLALLRDERA